MTVVAYNLGPMPGRLATDLVAAADVITSETGSLRTFPRLPHRGLGGDLVGTTCALIPQLPVEPGPRSWRLSARPQLFTRRLWDQVQRDGDMVEEQWSASTAPVQLEVLGPWALATAVELPNGHRAVTDSGALRDITEVLSHGITEHAAQLGRRFGSVVDVLLVEPWLAPLESGTLPGTSDFDVIARVHAKELGERLHAVCLALRGGGIRTVRISQIGVTPVLDIAQLAAADTMVLELEAIHGASMLDTVGEILSAGISLGIGCTLPKARPEFAREVALKVASLFDELSFGRSHITEKVEITTTTFLDSLPLIDAAHTLQTARLAADILNTDAGNL
ncbi:hypothetical protein CMUST_06525 [Corynebacterium mustelae]|uniref:Uncharacterized protein n=1 Tax=Corynebacterium mustelae TaxID=571915 RepID=A0A0G3GYQ3_9CORY|nr:hypothetical protein [Corynebacterium mustelae]AKK05640.1 hypothetical protein CMUST_06525 [Corynebacterium mustelae]